MINKFLKRFGVFFMIPFVFLFLIDIIVFYTQDPFRIIREYHDYSRAPINFEYVTMTVLEKNRSSHNYNSFIFGSSRLIGLKASSWKKHLKPSDEVYTMGAYFENIEGVYNKLKYLDASNTPIDNVILLIDPDMTFMPRNFSEISYNAIKHPDVSDNSWIFYYGFFLKSYFLPSVNNLIFKYHIYLDAFGLGSNDEVSGNVRDYDKIFDPITNELSVPEVDSFISDPANISFFEDTIRFPKITKENINENPMISEDFEQLLKDINSVFIKHNTKFYLIISPLYGQIKLDNRDMDKLSEIFGQENIYDFSGKNQFTESKYNYFESSHYRPHVGDSILSIIYKDQIH